MSDEVDCSLVVKNKKYNPKSPSLNAGMERINVTLSISITSILRIDEVDKFIQVQFYSNREWFDYRVKYKNLNLESNRNRLNTKDKEGVCFPLAEFSNIEDTSKEMFKSEIDKWIVIRNPNKTPSTDLTSVNNVKLYEGSSTC